MTEKDLIKNHILKLKSELVRGSCASQVAMETNCKEEAYDEILKFIEFLDGNDEIIMNVFLAKDKDNAPGNLFMFYPEYMRKVVGDSYASKIIDSGRLFRPIKLNDLYDLKRIQVYK